tara:strand:- start:169 stop:474 length:306 start_codon:yes stop_codon:yes gene_type:complete
MNLEKAYIYNVEMESGYKWRLVVCNDNGLAEASANLKADFFDNLEELQGTPYQTADARHSEYEAATLVWQYFAEDEDEEDDEVESVEPYEDDEDDEDEDSE